MVAKKPHINFVVLDRRWKQIKNLEASAVQVILKSLPFLDDYTYFEMSIVLSDDQYIKQLNHQYRGIEKPTNVLSFPSYQNDSSEIGDIILSYDTLYKEALLQKKAFMAHCQHLILHGFLHLLGYDHEENEDAAIMEKLEVQILEKVRIQNPYEDIL